ncbi:TniQ family protein [Agrobacterium sp. 22-223-1]
MRLPVNVTFHPEDETPLSLASRLARAMGYPSVNDLLSGGGTNVKAVVQGDDHAMRVLSYWSGVPVTDLQRFAVPVSEEAGEWRLGDAVFRKEMRVAGRFRFCPHCLEDDLVSGCGRPTARPYARAPWATRAVVACTRHGNILAEASAGEHANDFSLFVATGGHLVDQDVLAADESELMVDAYLERRIAGMKTQSFIDRQEVHVLLVLWLFLGSFVHRHLPHRDFSGRPASALGVRAVGYMIASEGAERIRSILLEAIELHRPDVATIVRFFGPSIRRFRENVDSPSFAEIVDLLQGLVQYFPLGAGDLFIRRVDRRSMHSIRSAAAEYGLDKKRVRKMLDERGLISRSNLPDYSVYFTAAEAESTLSDAAENITTADVASALGTTLEQVREMVERGLLAVAERGVKKSRPFYRVSRHELQRLVDRLFENVPLVTGDEDGLVTLWQVSRTKGHALVDVIEMIIDRKLTRLKRIDDTMKIGSLLVSPSEIAPSWKKADINEESIYATAREARRLLGTAASTVAALVEKGILPTVMRANPKTKRTQAFVLKRDIETFLDEHISLRRLARDRGLNVVTMKRQLDLAGVKLLYEPSGLITRFYRVKDVIEAEPPPTN